MIRHMVFVKLRTDAPAEKVDEMFAILKGLPKVLQGLESVTGGPYSSPEGINRGFTHGFSMDFVDAASRDAYLPHPEHAKLGESIGPILDGSFEDAVCAVDYEYQ